MSYYDIKKSYNVLYDEKDNKCKTDDDCLKNNGTGSCDIQSGICVKCTDDADCKGGYTCDSDNNCTEDSSQDVCYKGGTRVVNGIASFGIAFLNLAGLGGIPGLLGGKTPLEQVKGKVSELHDETQKLANQMTIAAMSNQNIINSEIYGSLVLEQGELQSSINYNKEILDEEIHINTIYIAASFILIMIILIYITYFTD